MINLDNSYLLCLLVVFIFIYRSKKFKAEVWARPVLSLEMGIE